MHQKEWRNKEMSDAQLLMDCAGPGSLKDNVQARLTRAARHIQIGYWRAFNIWHGKAQFSREEYQRAEAYRLRTTKDPKVLSDEFRKITDHMAMLEARIQQIDPEFHSESVAALRAARGLDRG